MKTKNSIITWIVLFMFVSLSVLIPEEKAMAYINGSLINVMEAPKAPAGQLISTPEGYRYQLKKNGNFAKKKWYYLNDKLYYFTTKGYAKTGILTYNNRNYYFNSKGVNVAGWKKINNYKYYFWKSASKGAAARSAAVGKVKISGYYYYFDAEGRMLTGWKKIGSYYYYFEPGTGRMAINKKVGKYYVNAKGRRTTPPSQNQQTGQVDIWVGDSRTVGLGSAIGISNKCIAQVSMGYTWFVNEGQYQLISKLNLNPTATVVCNLGVNDLHNANAYISIYRTLMNRFKKARFFFMSVNPLDYSKYVGPATDALVKQFNTSIKNAFPNQYIDTYTMLKPYISSNGSKHNSKYTDSMGLHYSSTIYKKIYDFVLERV